MKKNQVIKLEALLTGLKLLKGWLQKIPQKFLTPSPITILIFNIFTGIDAMTLEIISSIVLQEKWSIIQPDVESFSIKQKIL